VADAREELHVVTLEAHAGAAAVAEATAGQLVGDGLDRDGKQGRETLDDDDQGLAVGLPGGEVAQHTARVPADPPPTLAEAVSGPASRLPGPG
jgi:hypothetical protein